MEDLLARIWEHVGGRIGGPLSFRLILQPTVAASFAIRAGMQDARTGRPLRGPVNRIAAARHRHERP